MNLRRVGWPVGPDGAESLWKMGMCLNILSALKTTEKLKVLCSCLLSLRHGRLCVRSDGKELMKKWTTRKGVDGAGAESET